MKSDFYTLCVFIIQELDKKITEICTSPVPLFKDIAHMHIFNSLKALISHALEHHKGAIQASLFQIFLWTSIAIRIFQSRGKKWGNRSISKYNYQSLKTFENMK